MMSFEDWFIVAAIVLAVGVNVYGTYRCWVVQKELTRLQQRAADQYRVYVDLQQQLDRELKRLRETSSPASGGDFV